jgi:Protein of unknown function (DUF2752)
VLSTIPLHDGPRPVWFDRTIALVVFGLAVACVAVLWSVQPDAKGYDTHTQLGLAPCGWPRHYGVPCPTCGATTAAALLVHGRPWAAVATQPFGAAFAAFGLIFGALAGYCLFWRRSFLDVYLQLPRTALLFWFTLLLLGSWLFKYLTFAPTT